MLRTVISLVSADLQPPWWRWPVGSCQDLMLGWPNASTGSEGWPSVFGILLHKQRYVSWPTANKHEWIPWSPVMHMRWRSCWTISRVVSDSRRHSAHGLVIAANWFHTSVWCTQWAILTWMWFFDRCVIWCILHFVLYCTIDLSSTSNTLKMYLVISRGIK